MNNKIKTRKELKEIVKQLKQQNKKIVTTNGSFDLLHIGHIKFLQEAKKQGDVLIVGLNSDKSIKSYKGPERPIVPQEYRAEMLSALEYVDYVILFDEQEIASPLLNIVKPDIHANGAEYGKECIESKAIKNVGAQLYLIDKFEYFSTTNLIKKILELHKK